MTTNSTPTMTPDQSFSEPSTVCRIPTRVYDRLRPLLRDLGTDAVMSLLNPSSYLLSILPRVEALERAVFSSSAQSQPNPNQPLVPPHPALPPIVVNSPDSDSHTSCSDIDPQDSDPQQPDSQNTVVERQIELAGAAQADNTSDKLDNIDTKPTEPTEPTKSLSGTATVDQLPMYPETGLSLAQRWGITQPVLVRQRKRYHSRPRGFFEYSLKKEDGAFGWVYDPTEQLFYAVIHFPENLEN